MGEPPEDYTIMQAAKWLGIPVPAIADTPVWWLYKAIDYMSAEAEGQKSLADHNSRKT